MNTFESLINATGNEAEVQANLSNVIIELNHDPKWEYPADGGFADIYVPSAEMVVECKRRGNADPEGKGGNTSETQLEQLTRYVGAINDSLFDRPTRGMITDGADYYLYKFRRDKTKKRSFKPRLIEHKQFRNALQLREALTDIFDPNERECKPWVSDDLFDQFSIFLDPIRKLYMNWKQEKEVKTRFELWRQLLLTSGMDIGDSVEQVELFLQHTLLISVARAATATMESNHGGGGTRKYLNQGFVSWLLPLEGYSKTPQNSVAQDIFEEVSRFEWHRERKDIFRPFYERLIDKSRRHMYGEYYTPNWLAEWIVTEMLDESWIEHSVSKVISGQDDLTESGILDPCCGSGTFLYESVRHLISSKYVMDAAGGESDEGQRIVARLIHGFDIHPIAVEIAQASLKRLLPSVPTNRLNIAQTDSLMLSREEQNLFQRSDNVTFTPSVAADIPIRLPKRFIQSDNFDRSLSVLINSANEERSFPRVLRNGMSGKEIKILKETHEDLTKLCDRYGDGIWNWWIKNSVASYKLRHQKVDRILTNPPWVTINSIAGVQRQNEVKSLALSHDVWHGGRNATSFDIAAVIVLQTRSIFLCSHGKAAWILNESSARGEQWERFRKRYSRNHASVWRLGKLRESPFAGAASCIWIEDGKHRDITWYCNDLKNGKVDNNLNWKANSSRIHKRKTPKLPTTASSTYRNLPRQGATITPSCLSLIEHSSIKVTGNKVLATTIQSRHQPWKALDSMTVEIPKSWVSIVLQPSDYYPYGVVQPTTRAIVPMNSYGEVIGTRHGIMHPQWLKLDRLYRDHRGVGKATPKDLISQLDFSGKLSNQISSTPRYRLIYNTSGSWLRSVVLRGKLPLIDASTYRMDFNSKNEAYFVCAILNAQCLQGAFRLCRKSDRHFHKHVWNRIPIPKYRKSRDLDVAKAAIDCEQEVADYICKLDESVLDKPNKLNELVREYLTTAESAMLIEEYLRKLLPDFCDISTD